MSDSNDLLHLLHECASKRELTLNPLETAEVLWLRNRMLGTPAAPSRTQKVPAHPPPDSVIDADQGADETEPQGKPIETGEQQEETPSFPPHQLHDREAEFAPTEPNRTSDGAPAVRAPVFLDALPPLDDELAYARGLHRLSVKRRLPEKKEVDIEQSVAHTAAAGRATLVFRPVERHTMRLLILVDMAGQLAPWAKSFERIHELAQMVGSFAAVDLLWIDLGDAAKARLFGDALGKGELSAERLSHGSADQLVLILSDAAGPAVSSGALGVLLRRFAPGTRLAWLHPWDRALWERTQVTRLRMAQAVPMPADAKAPITVAMAQFSVDGLRVLEPWIRGRKSAGLQGWLIPSNPPREAPARRAPMAINWPEKARRIAGTIGPQALSVLALSAAIPGHIDVDLLYALCRWLEIPSERIDIAEAMSSGFLERVPGSGKGNNAILRFASAEARLAILAFVDRDSAHRVLDELTKHFQSPEARSRVKDLQIPIEILMRLSGVDDTLPRERMSADSESALRTIMQSIHGAAGLEILKRLEAKEPQEKTATPSTYRKKLIEVALPLEAINAASQRENYIYKGNPSAVHKWWAQRPLATARAVLFAQLVDDPSAWPDLFPTEKAQDKERQRLFRLIEKLVVWENSNDEIVLNAVRFEIARSWARSHPSAKSQAILQGAPSPKEVNEYLATEVPPVHDPFAGGGTIPLEAQRLGLRAIASDLNPVAVLINKALIEIPPKFAGRPPVNPVSSQKQGLNIWKEAQGLAEDVRYYGKWMRDEAFKLIGGLYPDIEIIKEMTETRQDLKGLEGQKFTIIAWIWARTVASPNPALHGAHVPLVSSFWLATKPGKEAWIEPIIDNARSSYSFNIRVGNDARFDSIDNGTKMGRGANFRCLLSDVPIEAEYVKAEGLAGRMGSRLMAIVLEGHRSRIYLAPTAEQENLALKAQPRWTPDQHLPRNPRWFSPPDYGMPLYADLFTSRQLLAITTLCDLVAETRAASAAHAKAVGFNHDSVALHEGGNGAAAYGDAVATYCAFAVSRLANYATNICTWHSGVKYETITSTFGRQALPMTWDYAEGNPFSESTGNFLKQIDSIAANLENTPLHALPALVIHADAGSISQEEHAFIATDPPYYDNIGYADLSDFFYVWLRQALRTIHPSLTATMLTPKEQELIAAPYRHGGNEAAEKFFLVGMSRAIQRLSARMITSSAATLFYAFKQAENVGSDAPSTGWETFLQGLLGSGLGIVGTWPVRSELVGNLKKNVNALASSIVLVCTKKDPRAPTIPRGDFRRMLRQEMPAALKALRHGSVAPVDMEQASLGPGMAIFSRYSKVLDADGQPMTVGAAIQMINESRQHDDADSEIDVHSRFAITWYEQHGWDAGLFGEAETLAKARNVSVTSVAQARLTQALAGKVRLLKRTEMPADWNPSPDERPPVWEATQHLIKRLEEQDEHAAARLLKQLGPVAEQARDLAYRLYSTCDRKRWTEDARSYNGLVAAWGELEKIAAGITLDAPPTGQVDLFGNLISPEKPTKGGKRKAKGKGTT